MTMVDVGLRYKTHLFGVFCRLVWGLKSIWVSRNEDRCDSLLCREILREHFFWFPLFCIGVTAGLAFCLLSLPISFA